MEYQPVTTIFSNEQFITNQFGDRFLYSINRHGFDHVGSDAVYNAHWGGELFKEATLYIIAGCDSGVLIKYLQKKDLPKGSRYLIVELPEIIELVQPLINSDLYADKILLCTIEDWLEVARKNSLPAYAYLDSVRVIRSLAVDDGNVPEYRSLWRELDKSSQQTLWSFRIEFGNTTFYIRQIENVCENRTSAYCLKGVFKDKTAVLLAGGPSLDSILPWVIENRESLIVVAVSRICRRLQQANLVPDIIVTVDPHAWSFDVSKHMLHFSQQSILVNAFHATPLLLAQWGGPSLYLDKRYPWKTKDEKHSIKGMGPTVSNSAINLIVAMGCKQIILAGLDLCFSEEGFSHAKGSDERSLGAFIAYGTQTVKTNSGLIAETDNDFYCAVKSIEVQAKHALEQGCQLINPSPRAAAIEDVLFLPLEDIQLTPLATPAIELLRAVLPEDNSNHRTRSYQQALKEFSKTEHTITKIKELARIALEHNDGLFGRNGKETDFKHKIQMDKIEKQLNREYKDYAALCKIFGMREFVQTFSPTAAEDWSDEEIENKGRTYYQAYITGADNLLTIIQTAKQRIQSRIEEEQSNPDFDVLFKQWENDKQPRRAFIWQAFHPEQANILPAPIKEKMRKFDAAFQTELDNSDHSYLKVLNQYAALNGVTGKALEFFKNKDKYGLERMLKGLQTRTGQASEVLFHLVSGYDSELVNHIDDAVEHYHAVVINESDPNNPALENSLLRLVYLALEEKQLESASAYLEALCGLSTLYMPQYAEILRLTDQIPKSIDVYTEYLTRVPQDLSTMMKLGILYKKIGVKEGAQWMFEHILQKDPLNNAAQEMLKQVKLSA